MAGYGRNDRGDSHTSSGAGERANGTFKALTEIIPMIREVVTILENMLIGGVVRKNRWHRAKGLEGWVGELVGAAQRLRKRWGAARPLIDLRNPRMLGFRPASSSSPPPALGRGQMHYGRNFGVNRVEWLIRGLAITPCLFPLC